MLVVSTAGYKTSVDTADKFNIGTGTANADDLMFVTHFKDGVVKSCTKGFEKNMGSVSGASPITGCN